MPGMANPKLPSVVNRIKMPSSPQPLQMVGGVVQGWNVSLFNNATLTANANFTMPLPTGLYPGASGILAIWQDVTGSRVVTWASGYNGRFNTRPILNTNGGALDEIGWYSLDGKTVTIQIINTVTTATGPTPGSVLFTTGTGATWTVPSGYTLLQIECWGDGGGSGDGNSGFGGSGGGAYCIKANITVVGGTTVVTYSVGQGGAAAPGRTTGSNGSGTTATMTGVSLSAGGGIAATNDSGNGAAGGAGGTATGGDTNTPGTAGATCSSGPPIGGAGGAGAIGGAGGIPGGASPIAPGGGAAGGRHIAYGAGAIGQVKFSYS